MARWYHRDLQIRRRAGRPHLDVVDVSGWRWLASSAIQRTCDVLRHPCMTWVPVHRLLTWAAGLTESGSRIILSVPLSSDQADALHRITNDSGLDETDVALAYPRFGPAGRLLSRPTQLQLAQGRQIRLLAKAFWQHADNAVDVRDRTSWRDAYRLLSHAADVIDGAPHLIERIGLTEEEAHAITACMNDIPASSGPSYGWRQGLTYVDAGPGYCDLVIRRANAGSDIVQAISRASPADPKTRAALDSVRQKITAHAAASHLDTADDPHSDPNP